jgi:5'-3' exonuclease
MILVEQTGKAPFIIREQTVSENIESNTVQNYEFLDVTALIEDICEKGSDSLSKKQKILNHVIASFLVGNDFLPPLSYLNIKHGGLQDVIEMCHAPLCSETGYVIEWNNLCEVIHGIASKEDSEFAKRDERYWSTKSPVTDDPVVIWDNYPIINKNYKLKHIAPGKPGWVPRYYDYLFYTKDISSIVKRYIVGIQWTLDYYTGKYCKNTPCWQFLHAYAPTAIDVHNFIAANPDEVPKIVGDEINALKMYEYDPYVALLMVTPPSSFEILSPRLRALTTDINFGIAHCFPEDFTIHTYLRRWAHECKANIPPVDIEKFRNAVEKINSFN